jgi:hypothetical protein
LPESKGGRLRFAVSTCEPTKMVVSNVSGDRCPRLLTAGDALHLARRRVGPTGPRKARPDDRLRCTPPLPESKDGGLSFAKILRALVSETERPQNARRRSRKKWPRLGANCGPRLGRHKLTTPKGKTLINFGFPRQSAPSAREFDWSGRRRRARYRR